MTLISVKFSDVFVLNSFSRLRWLRCLFLFHSFVFYEKKKLILLIFGKCSDTFKFDLSYSHAHMKVLTTLSQRGACARFVALDAVNWRSVSSSSSSLGIIERCAHRLLWLHDHHGARCIDSAHTKFNFFFYFVEKQPQWRRKNMKKNKRCNVITRRGNI